MLSNTSNNVVKISAAGAGKTWEICHEALEVGKQGRQALIVSYTNRGIGAVRKEICKQNDGVLHENVAVKTWYKFLLSDMIKPYQNYLTGLKNINVLRSVDYSQTYGHINRFSKGSIRRYVTSANNILSNHVSEMAFYLNRRSGSKVIHRLEEHYSNIYFDEVQDLAGYDLNLLELLMMSRVGITCCGDSKQATYKTHNARKNAKISGANIWEFFDQCKDRIIIREEKNLTSRRFNQQICDFANEIFPGGEAVTTSMTETTNHDGVFLIDISDMDSYYRNYNPQVLRYDMKKKCDVRYRAINYGACKGETFDRVMILPNNVLKDFILKKKVLSSPVKYYVAVTRPRYSIAIVMDKLPDSLSSYEKTEIAVEGRSINAFRYVSAMG